MYLEYRDTLYTFLKKNSKLKKTQTLVKLAEFFIFSLLFDRFCFFPTSQLAYHKKVQDEKM